MNGPDHYREAERLLTTAKDAIYESAQKGDANLDAALEVSGPAIAAAHVHATLALTAASIEGRIVEGDHEAWTEALS